MISFDDPDYAATKRIKQGGARLAAPFDELAAWISATWHVTVLNVIYDRATDLHATRLSVILEHAEDQQLFRDGYNYDEQKQLAITAKFLEIINQQPSHTFDVAGLYVVFSAFAPCAKEEADSKLSESDIESLQNRIADPDLWVISRCFGHVTFMFYTDKQAKHHAAVKKITYARMYFDILKPFDEFGYLVEKDYTVAFDSKQNFDKNYQGNWFKYYR